MTSVIKRPRVAIVFLGGTIASTNDSLGNDQSGVRPQLGADAILATVPGLDDVAELETLTFRQVPSGDLTLDDMTELATLVKEVVAAGAAGVVIVQGTDTLEETSFALDLLVRVEAPVVFTGAMRNPTVLGSDGAANILAAVQVAASPSAAGLGTLVVANDEIHAARFVRKTHATSLATFQSPSAGPIGWVAEGRARIVFRVPPLRVDEYGAGGPIPPVALLTCALGDDARQLSVIEDLGYVGVVIEAFGAGHVPARVMPALAALAARVPVVFSSRTGGGSVLATTYGFAGSERDMLSRGLISAGVLDGPKARVLLSLALSRGLDIAGVTTVFNNFNDDVTSWDGR